MAKKNSRSIPKKAAVAKDLRTGFANPSPLLGISPMPTGLPGLGGTEPHHHSMRSSSPRTVHSHGRRKKF